MIPYGKRHPVVLRWISIKNLTFNPSPNAGLDLTVCIVQVCARQLRHGVGCVPDAKHATQHGGGGGRR